MVGRVTEELACQAPAAPVRELVITQTYGARTWGQGSLWKGAWHLGLLFPLRSLLVSVVGIESSSFPSVPGTLKYELIGK